MSDLRVFFVSKRGNDSNTGQSAAAPVATVAKGVALAAAAGGGEVRVTTGQFDETPIELPGGVTISGGWDPSFTDQKRNLFTYRQLREIKEGKDLSADHTCVTTTSGDRVFSIRNSKATAAPILSQLVVIGPDRTGVVGDSSYGVVVDEAAAALDFVVICAGKGGTGQAGEKGRDGAGFSSSVRGGAGGDRNRKPLFPGEVVEDGLDGDWVDFNGVRVAIGGPGGHGGLYIANRVLDAKIYGDCQDGSPGWNGWGGVQGAPGTAAKLDYGFFTKLNGDLHWMGEVGGQGAAGSPGSGGGGGGAGAGGSYTYSPHLNDHFGQPSSGIVVYGGKGSDGGNGGAPGGGGYGGYSGGGAFGLVINNSTVTSAGLVLIGGKGGRGGAGGPGGKGSPGQPGYDLRVRGTSTGQQPERFGGYGGRGGDGGRGGGGGGGAGGNGGPVIHVVLLAEGRLKCNGVLRHQGGSYGEVGLGGAGRDDQYSAPAGHSKAVSPLMKLELRK